MRIEDNLASAAAASTMEKKRLEKSFFWDFPLAMIIRRTKKTNNSIKVPGDGGGTEFGEETAHLKHQSILY